MNEGEPAVALRAGTQSTLSTLGLAFVVVWCTGYIAGKLMMVHAAPFTALVWRFGLAALVFAILAMPRGVTRGSRRDWLHSAVTGLLMLAMQFGGVYLGFGLGASAGVAALVIGAMPLMVAVLAMLAGTERLGIAQWLGLAIGFCGVLLVVADRVDGATSPGAWLALIVGLIGIGGGTLYQKRFASAIDMRVGLAIQNAVATLALLPIALWSEGFRFDPDAAFYLPLAWTVLVNSVGGFALLFLLIRRGAATAVAALFFLMPPVTAFMGHVVLGEHLTPLKLGGFVLAALGVWLATRPRAAAASSSPG